jgi:hypothetical protein
MSERITGIVEVVQATRPVVMLRFALVKVEYAGE